MLGAFSVSLVILKCIKNHCRLQLLCYRTLKLNLPSNCIYQLLPDFSLSSLPCCFPSLQVTSVLHFTPMQSTLFQFHRQVRTRDLFYAWLIPVIIMSSRFIFLLQMLAPHHVCCQVILHCICRTHVFIHSHVSRNLISLLDPHEEQCNKHGCIGVSLVH